MKFVRLTNQLSDGVRGNEVAVNMALASEFFANPEEEGGTIIMFGFEADGGQAFLHVAETYDQVVSAVDIDSWH